MVGGEEKLGVLVHFFLQKPFPSQTQPPEERAQERSQVPWGSRPPATGQRASVPHRTGGNETRGRARPGRRVTRGELGSSRNACLLSFCKAHTLSWADNAAELFSGGMTRFRTCAMACATLRHSRAVSRVLANVTGEQDRAALTPELPATAGPVVAAAVRPEAG